MRKLVNILSLFVLALTPSLALNAQTITTGSQQVLMTPSARPGGFLDWADCNMGVQLIGGTYYFFSCSGYIPAAGSSGSQGFTSSDLNSLESNYQPINTNKNIGLGQSGGFDEDYVGGGPIMYDAPDNMLVMMYHGEYWYGGSGSRFIAGLGLAVSRDLGVTWNKLGEVISPNIAWPNLSQGCNEDTGVGTLNSRSDGYTYAYFVDVNSSNSCVPYTAVARAKTSDLISAALGGGQPSGSLFQKYSGGSFSTPGVNDPNTPANGGGASDNIVRGVLAYVPDVKFDSSINQYIMSYIAAANGTWSGISIQFSSDGLNWGSPQTVTTGGTLPGGGNAFLYPTMLNTSGGDPNVLGSSFYIYYTNIQSTPSFAWTGTNLSRIQVTLNNAPVTTTTKPPAPTGLTANVD